MTTYQSLDIGIETRTERSLRAYTMSAIIEDRDIKGLARAMGDKGVKITLRIGDKIFTEEKSSTIKQDTEVKRPWFFCPDRKCKGDCNYPSHTMPRM